MERDGNTNYFIQKYVAYIIYIKWKFMRKLGYLKLNLLYNRVSCSCIYQHLPLRYYVLYSS